jgi:hypothetical protein
MDKNHPLFVEYVVLSEAQRKNPNMSFQHLSQIQEHLVREVLVNPYPDMFGHCRLGISVGAGWYDILERMAKGIQDVINTNPGFHVTFVQIKEKFGGLRAYCRNWSDDGDRGEFGERTFSVGYTTASEQVFKLICAAEDEAIRTCELCGEPGTLRDHSWIHVACDKHVKPKR